MPKFKLEENTGIHLDRLIGLAPCARHNADIGQACWNIPTMRGYVRAICDRRARSAGANGDINEDPQQKIAPVRASHDHYKKKEYNR